MPVCAPQPKATFPRRSCRTRSRRQCPPAAETAAEPGNVPMPGRHAGQRCQNRGQHAAQSCQSLARHNAHSKNLLYGEVVAFGPFVPGAVVVGQAGVAQLGQGEQDRRCGHAPIAISDVLAVGVCAGGGQDFAQFGSRAKRAVRGEQGFTQARFLRRVYARRACRARRGLCTAPRRGHRARQRRDCQAGRVRLPPLPASRVEGGA